MLTLREHPSRHYGPRTFQNAATACLTIAFAVDFRTAGERLTRRAAGERWIAIDVRSMTPAAAAQRILERLPEGNGLAVNIAGNGLSTLSRHGWDQARITAYVTATLARVTSARSLGTIVSGGQTGADMAGLVAARFLGIAAIGTLPCGWMQRGADGVDRARGRDAIAAEIVAGCAALAADPRMVAGTADDANTLTPHAIPWDNEACSSMVHAMLPLSAQSWCFLDTETTGADPTAARVVQIAWSLQQGWSDAAAASAAPCATMVALPDGQGIPPGASAVHHIRDADLQGAPAWPAVMDTFLGDLRARTPAGDPDPILVAFNSPYDRTFFAGHALDAMPWLDAMRLAVRTWHIGQPNARGWPLTSFKQQELRYWLDLPPVDGAAHTAAADIAVTALLFGRAVTDYLAAGHPDDVTAFRAWLDSPIPHVTIPFGERAIIGKRFDELSDEQLNRMTWNNSYYRDAYRQWNLLEMATEALRARSRQRTEEARLQLGGAVRSPTTPAHAFRPIAAPSPIRSGAPVAANAGASPAQPPPATSVTPAAARFRRIHPTPPST